MCLFGDIFNFDDDLFLMWPFGTNMGSIFKLEEISEKQCGFIDDHENQEAQSVVQDSQVTLQEGCEGEQSVEDQRDELDEANFKDVAKENKAEKKLNCDDLVNIFVCENVTNNTMEKVTKFEEELNFLEAWLETPFLYEIDMEVAIMNGEYIIAGVHIVDTRNSDKENSRI